VCGSAGYFWQFVLRVSGRFAVKKLWGRVGLLAVLLVGVLALAPAGASAEPLCTDTWVGPSEGNWSTESDWSTGERPTGGSVVCIGSGKTVSVSFRGSEAGVVQGNGTLVVESSGALEVKDALEPSTITSLSITGGELITSAEMDVTHTFSVGRGVGEYPKLKGSGRVVIESSATGTIYGGLNVVGGTLVNTGTLTIGRASEESEFIEGEEHGLLTNSGKLIVNTKNQAAPSDPEFTVVNTGKLEKTEAGPTTFGLPIDNEGSVEVTAGKLSFFGGGPTPEHSTGSWSASGTETAIDFDGAPSEPFSLGSTVRFDGQIEVDSGTVKAGKIEGSNATFAVNGDSLGEAENGVLEISSGVSEVKGLALGAPLGGEGGVLKGSGKMIVTKSFGVSKGRIYGSLVLDLTSTVVGTISGKLRQSAATLENAGTLTVETPESATFELENKAVLDNTGTLVVNTRNQASPYDEGTLINRGTLKKTEGAWTTEINVPTENLGTIREEVGNFKFGNPIHLRESSTQWGGAENPSAPAEPHPTCGDPVSCATGNYSETQTDFAIGGRGVGLALTRTYNSQAAAEGVKGLFGYGWTSSFSDHLVVNKTSKVTTLHQANGSTVPFTEEGGGSFKAPVWTQDILSGTEGTGYTLTLPSQIKYKFAGSSGRLESVTDRDGNVTTLTYNEAGQLTTITDPVSRTIKLKYNGEGFVESAEDPMKHVIKYTYEGENLKSVTQPAEESLRWQFKYDGSHRMTEMVDGRSGKTINEYNGSNQVTKQEDPAGHKLKFEYETFQTKITNENTGSVTDEYFTSDDEPSSITRGYGTESATTESFTYNEGGYVTSVTDGNGHTTTYGYDAANDRTSMVDPNKNETKWTYDSTHDVETMTTPKGETTTIKREAHGNPEVIERPAPESKTQVTKYKYKTTGELESVTNPLEHTWKYEYDAKGDRTAETDPEGNKRTWEDNEDSQETATVSPRGNIKEGKPASFTTKIERDAQGRAIKVTDPLSHVTEYKYDGDGNVEVVTDGNKHKTKYTYNGDNEPTKVEAPNKTVTETEYNGAGQVVKQIDGNKHATEYKRNAVGEVTEVINPLGKKTLKEYDAAGNLIKLTDPAKRTTTYKYDPANRLEEVSYSSGKPATVKYEYDKDGDRTKMTDGTGTTVYTYDQLDRLTESENGNKEVIKYEYDLANDQTKITYPNKKAVTRAFDKDGRLEKLTDWLSHSTKFTYDEDSDLKTILFPSETKDEDTYAYNDADQMSEVKMKKSTETLASLVYTRDGDGQVKKITSKGLPGAEVTENTYDENNRLTKYGSTEYKYDSANNPTTEGSSTNTFNEGDELEKGTGTTYAYDELGERTKTTPEKGGAITYGYDQAGNLTSVERPEKESTPKIEDSYTYDGNSLRASQTISGTTTYFAWDMTEELPLILSDGTNSYIYGPGGLPVEQISGAETPTYLHHDQQGSIRLLTGSAGTSTGSVTFDAYGNKVESTGTISPLGYDGQYTNSDTGLIYLRARVYDPTTAQFLSVDPIEPITTAPYNYAGDNPTNAIDPTGLLCFSLSSSCLEEDAGEAVEASARVAATAVKISPLGQDLEVTSEASGKTVGVCGGGGFTGGGSIHVSACYVASPNGQSAVTYTGGGGAGYPIGFNGFLGGTVSNAQSPSDLGRQFYTVGGSVGRLADNFGGSLSFGHNSCGRTIWQASGGWTPGEGFGPGASGYAGTSYTLVYESF
jgi:RHS repeat-associated protein